MSVRWAFMEKFEVPDYDDPSVNHMTRLRIVQTPWFAVYLHRFDGPDPRPTLHDHPWPFASFVLKGSYREHTPVHPGTTVTRERRVRRLNVKRATDLHYISVIERHPTWTLMIVGRRRREWGYVEDDGTWTQFDLHPYNALFEAALAQRRRAS